MTNFRSYFTASILLLIHAKGGRSLINMADVPCGLFSSSSTATFGGSRRSFSRILNGNEAKMENYPFSVSIQKSGEHYCGGAIVSRNYVVTAAHCLHSYPEHVWTVYAGTVNVDESSPPHQKFKVLEIIKHPNYSFPKFHDDLALIRLDKPIKWNTLVQPVCVTENHNLANDVGTLTGWGLDNEKKKGGKATHRLNAVNLPILENSECESWFHSEGKKITIDPSRLCAGYREGEKDGCQGDSGGGLVVIEDGKLSIVGIMSAGIGCGRPKLPGIYTRMTIFNEWLQSMISRPL